MEGGVPYQGMLVEEVHHQEEGVVEEGLRRGEVGEGVNLLALLASLDPPLHYIHTEISSLKWREVNSRSQACLRIGKSRIGKRYVQSG